MKKYFLFISFSILLLSLSSAGKIAASASEENFIGKDLYKGILTRIQDQSTQLAIERTLAQRNLSKEELLILIPGSNIGGLLSKPSPKENLTPAQVEERRAELQRFFEEERELAELEVRTKMEVEPTEIFANGDESDSEFDLLTDLEIIETILFGRTETAFGSRPGGARPGSRLVGPGVGRSEAGSVRREVARSDTSAVSARGDRASQTSLIIPASQVQAIPEESAPLCAINASFHNAVVQARAREKQKNQIPVEPSVGREARETSRRPLAGGTGDAGASTGKIASQPITPEPPLDWSRSRPCDGIFCLTFEAVYKKRSSYTASENCIACHFEKMNDSFNQTLSHNVVPSKVTGNLLEAPKCKIAAGLSLFNIDFRPILLSQPILTPPNDDLIVKGDFIKNAELFFEKYFKNPGRCDVLGPAGGSCKPDPNPIEQILHSVPEGTDQKKVLEDIRRQAAISRQEGEKLLQESRVENDAVNLAEQFQVLIQELSAMNKYFESFATLYKQLSSSQSDSPCTLLKNKETCS